MADIKGVIFDLDGTLISSRLNFKMMREMVGCPAATDILSYIDTLPIAEQRIANQIVCDMELDDVETCVWMPGAQEFVWSLKGRNIPMAIVTRNSSHVAKLKLEKHNVPIDLVYSREDAPAKPDPAALLEIASNWNIHCENLCYVGDFKYDIEAALNASMVSVLIHFGIEPEYSNLADVSISEFSQLMV